MKTPCCALLVALTACAPVIPASRPNPVGLTSAKYEDETRANWSDTGPRPLFTAVWYPAAEGTSQSAWDVSIFHAGINHLEAPMAPSDERRPLIVISHGTGGSAATMAWLAETLASHGYVVAAVNHHGNTGAEDEHHLEGFVVWWDRALDVRVVIDRLLEDPRFAPYIDASRIGVAGFSIGAYTALATIGGRLSQQQWSEFCAANVASSNCKLPPEAPYTQADLDALLEQDPRVQRAIAHMGDDFADHRVAGAFAIAPVLGPVFTSASLSSISVPTRLLVGSADDQAVPAVNAEPLSAAIPGASLLTLPGVTHYTFLPPCTWAGALAKPQFCSDPPEIDRERIHEQVAIDAVTFFDQLFAR